MVRYRSHASWRPLSALWFVLAAVLMVGPAGCDSDKQKTTAVKDKTTRAESFTFFDLGADSIYSETTRRSLKEKLGNDAVSHRNMVNLEVNYPGFLNRYFADLDNLNQRFNSDIGERVDHNTIKLMYRYARKRDLPFEYVEILFSNYSQHPILLKIRFKQDTLGTIDRLKTKYGPPKEIAWAQEGGKTLFWQKQQDYLLVSLVPDQFGVPEHRIAIFFTENLEALIQTEQSEKLRSGQEQSKSGKSAF